MRAGRRLYVSEHQMIPKEYRTSRIDALQQILNTLGGDLSALAGLHPDDLHLIGAYIQRFNFIELNVRRSIEVFARIKMLDASIARRHHKLPSSQLVPTLKSAVARLDPRVEDIGDSQEKLDEIEFRRGIRNLLAHWAAKRLPGEDAIVLMSKDGRDERQISGDDAYQPDYVRTAILDLADVRGLLEHIGNYETWIAFKASEWHARYLGSFEQPPHPP